MTTIFETPEDALRRLEQIGVPLEPLQRAMASGYAGRLSSTDNDAPFMAGTLAWGMTLRGLREGLRPLGWEKSDPGNFSLVSSARRQLNIVVESGDAATCRSFVAPRTKAPKGLYLEAVVLRNRIRGDLFPETLSEELRRVAVALQHPTWVLLVYITLQECRAELSLPSSMENEHVSDWDERIFVPPPPELGGATGGLHLTPTSPIEIVVTRKVA